MTCETSDAGKESVDSSIIQCIGNGDIQENLAPLEPTSENENGTSQCRSFN